MFLTNYWHTCVAMHSGDMRFYKRLDREIDEDALEQTYCLRRPTASSTVLAPAYARRLSAVATY